MAAVKDNSFLPMLLSITGAVLAVTAGGWLFLDQERPAASEYRPNPVVAPLASSLVRTDPEHFEIEEVPVRAKIEANATLPPPPATAVDEDAPNVEAELRKARLAADADILLLPEDQSALYYYGLVLKKNPGHVVAAAELNAILAEVEQTVAQHLEAQEFDNAFVIARLVGRQRPEHPLVTNTQQALDEHTERLVRNAMTAARKGDDASADQLIARAEALPGRNPSYFAAVRESIAEIRDVRLAAEHDRTRRARLADDEARAAWVEIVEEAITAGNLVSPAGASARDLLSEENAWDAERDRLTDKLLVALVDTIKAHIDAGSLSEAEALLGDLVELGGQAREYAELSSDLEKAYIAAKSNRIAFMSQLVQTKNVRPRYPVSAQRRNLTGWVEVFFTVTPSGETTNIRVRNSEPQEIFDQAAMDAVSEWEFEPVEFRGQLISQRAAAKLVFTLQ